jgi:flavin-binding protein dodecin
MANHTYKKIELVGSSCDSIESAVQNALKRAGERIRNIRWVEVNEIRGSVVDAKIKHWQVGVKIGFTLEANDTADPVEVKKQPT